MLYGSRIEVYTQWHMSVTLSRNLEKEAHFWRQVSVGFLQGAELGPYVAGHTSL